MKKHYLVSTITCLGLLSTPIHGLAQVGSGIASQLEEVIVTARKRAENLQRVPMAVSAFNAEQLRDAQVTNIVDLDRMTPNITIHETSGLAAGNLQVYIRGIGNDAGFDQGVGVYVDDVYLNRSIGALLEVYDIERIEILKGPQGNLYGRNTIGGAIKHITRRPSDELRMGIEGVTGTDDLVRIKGNVSGPIMTNTLYGGLAFMSEQRDGYQTNQFDGEEWADRDVWSARGTLVWNATDAVSVMLAADYSDDSSKPVIPVRVAVNEESALAISDRLVGANEIFGPGSAVFDMPTDVSLPSDIDTVNTAFLSPGFNDWKLKTASVAATVRWDFSDAWSLKSVSAYRELEYTTIFDFDGNRQIVGQALNDLESDDFSQELQFNYDGSAVNAVFGVYYLDGTEDRVGPGNDILSPRLLFFSENELINSLDNSSSIESTSVYGNIDWDFAENWQVSLGGRYTEDRKEQYVKTTIVETFYPGALAFTESGDIDLFMIRAGAEEMVEMHPSFLSWFTNDAASALIASGRPSDPPLDSDVITRAITVEYDTIADDKDKWTEFTPSLKVSFFPSEDTMLYAGMSSGFKSGGFAGEGIGEEPFDPETVDSYTVGLKTTLLDGRLRLNTEIFYNDYQDKQLAVIRLRDDGILVNTKENVGKVESSGGELELVWLPCVEGLTLGFNVGYLDSDIEEYLQPDDAGNIVNAADDFELGFSPEWTVQSRASYEFDVASVGRVLLGADVAYRDDMYVDSPINRTDAFRSKAQSDSITLYNAVVAFTSHSGNWRLALEGKNLSDERELVNTFVVSDYMGGGYNRERTWALSLRYDL